VKSVCKQSSASERGKYVFFEVLSLVLHVMCSIVYTVIRTITLGVGSNTETIIECTVCSCSAIRKTRWMLNIVRVS